MPEDNYVNISAETAAEKLGAIDCFLLDMDGTIYLGEKLISGTLEFLAACARLGKKTLFLTNNSSRSAVHYIKKLERLGVPEEFRSIYTSGQATAEYLLSTHSGKRVWLLGNDFLRAEMQAAGVNICDDAPEIVCIGYDTTLDYKKMCDVCRLVRAGLPYIATHPDFNCPTDTGFDPDIGAIIAFIEASAQRTPDIIIGKPNAGIIHGACRIAGCSASRAAMVGDRMYTDIQAGNEHCGLSVLVLSGETKARDLQTSNIKPGLVFEKLSDMIKYM